MTTTPRTLLVLGGTSWLGGAVARLARDRGHEVTCLARGRSGAAPDGVRFVSADRWRPGAYDAVADRDWDSVLDVSWQPELVRGAVQALSGRAGHWVYVSSLSAYADDSVSGRDESDVLHPPWSGSGEAVIEDYGPAKVACEDACVEALGADRVLVARAGLIVGYGDRSDRFGYWPARVAGAVDSRETVLIPPRDLPVQVIDVDDLAAWLVHSVETETVGRFNATGDTLSFDDVLAACVEAAGTRPRFVAADGAFLADRGVEPWMGPESLPLWLPLEGYAGFSSRTNHAAKEAGLTVRPLLETAREALAWERELGLDRTDRSAGLSPDRERALLAELGDR
ncbi:MAG: NAD-dependent epimerase/dehydratase family protein [Nocardioidaceae bacterium]